MFVKPIHKPNKAVQGTYRKKQEANRQDIERSFGALQARFMILRHECAPWELRDIVRVSETCVLVDNIIMRMSLKTDDRCACKDAEAWHVYE